MRQFRGLIHLNILWLGHITKDAGYCAVIPHGGPSDIGTQIVALDGFGRSDWVRIRPADGRHAQDAR